jgi:hypothetical protein
MQPHNFKLRKCFCRVSKKFSTDHILHGYAGLRISALWILDSNPLDSDCEFWIPAPDILHSLSQSLRGHVLASAMKRRVLGECKCRRLLIGLYNNENQPEVKLKNTHLKAGTQHTWFRSVLISF